MPVFATQSSNHITQALTTTSASIAVTNGAAFKWVKVYNASADVHLSVENPADTADTFFPAGLVDYFNTEGARRSR